MSLDVIRALLEAQLDDVTLSPSIDTVLDNESYKAVTDVPYQVVSLMPAEPHTYGLAMGEREHGVFQIRLVYPSAAGAAAAEARAEAIRDAYPRNLKLTDEDSGITVKIMKKPTIHPGFPDGARWAVPVSIYWSDR